MNFFQQAEQAKQRLVSIRNAKRDLLDSIVTDDDVADMQKAFKRDMALHAIGEAAKFNPTKAWAEIQAAKQKRELDLIAIAGIEHLEIETTEAVKDTRNKLESCEQHFIQCLESIKSGLNYYPEFVADVGRRGYERAFEAARESEYVGFRCLMAIPKTIESFQNLGGPEKLSRDVTATVKECQGVIRMLETRRAG